MISCRKKRGFSTLEVLAAVTIVIILAAIVLGVGKRLKTQAEEKLVKSTIGILVTAITQYYKFWDKFPAQQIGIEPVERCEQLYKQLYSTPSSKSFCEKIDSTMIGDTDGDGEFEFLDPWAKPLDYRYSTGDSFPVVESGGPDGKLDTKADNISSRDM
ncbi:MAG: hypothetical protein DRP65_00310 [Planctomycetota bacterium]|nr:MAG: hypothetical protein DRP65_00310 [Planctomycetota bacterium]